MDPQRPTTPCPPNRIIQALGAVFILGACVCLGLWLAQGTIVSLGCHQQGYSVYLTDAGVPVADTAIADRVREAADVSAQAPSAAELSAVAAAALDRARAKARSKFPDAGSPTVAALNDLRSEQIQFEWQPASFDAEVVLAGSVAFQTGKKDPDVPPLEKGKVFFARVEAQVVPWPRKPGYTKHPEILLAQSSVSWHSPVPGLDMLAKELATGLAERAAKTVQQAADAQGIEASRKPPSSASRKVR
ncbi:MAG: hypothetical protein ACYST0_10660 [Planctomycetota bacterium]|jgi:hypothetical protein